MPVVLTLTARIDVPQVIPNKYQEKWSNNTKNAVDAYVSGIEEAAVSIPEVIQNIFIKSQIPWEQTVTFNDTGGGDTDAVIKAKRRYKLKNEVSAQKYIDNTRAAAEDGRITKRIDEALEKWARGMSLVPVNWGALVKGIAPWFVDMLDGKIEAIDEIPPGCAYFGDINAHHGWLIQDPLRRTLARANVNAALNKSITKVAQALMGGDDIVTIKTHFGNLLTSVLQANASAGNTITGNFVVLSGYESVRVDVSTP